MRRCRLGSSTLGQRCLWRIEHHNGDVERDQLLLASIGFRNDDELDQNILGSANGQTSGNT